MNKITHTELGLPEFYAIQCDMVRNDGQSEAMEHFNRIHDTSFQGYGMRFYGYDGSDNRTGTRGTDHLTHFVNKVKVLSPAQYLEIIKNTLYRNREIVGDIVSDFVKQTTAELVKGITT